MSALLVTAGRVVADGEVCAPGWLAIEGSRIAGYGRGAAPAGTSRLPRLDDPTGTLLPGFVDVHVHGGVGHDTMDADPEGLAAVARHLATSGVTAFCATTWAAPRQATARALDAVRAAMAAPTGGARLLGAHLEGPYLSPARPGVQDPTALRPVDRGEATALLDTGVVRLVTLAPEVPDADWLIDTCRRRGVTASAGHTDATYEQVSAAAAAGVTHVTHTFNAMRPLHHREPGAVGAALDLPVLRCEVIADGVHVHPASLRLLLAAKGPRGVVLISDAVRAAGLPDGSAVDLAGERLVRRGQLLRTADGRLAGSVLTLDAALRTLCDATGGDVADLWPAASLNAAEAAGVAGDTGSIRVGKAGDLVLLDEDRRVGATVVGGHIVHSSDAGARRHA